MEPTKFTAAELKQLIAETVPWMQEQREKFLPSSHPLTAEQESRLKPFFFAAILSRLRIVDASKTFLTVAVQVKFSGWQRTHDGR